MQQMLLNLLINAEQALTARRQARDHHSHHDDERGARPDAGRRHGPGFRSTFRKKSSILLHHETEGTGTGSAVDLLRDRARPRRPDLGAFRAWPRAMFAVDLMRTPHASPHYAAPMPSAAARVADGKLSVLLVDDEEGCAARS